MTLANCWKTQVKFLGCQTQRSQNPWKIPWKIPDFISHEIPLDPYENSLLGPDVRSRFFMARAQGLCFSRLQVLFHFQALHQKLQCQRCGGHYLTRAKESHESDILKVRVFVGFHFLGKLDRKTWGRKTAMPKSSLVP